MGSQRVIYFYMFSFSDSETLSRRTFGSSSYPHHSLLHLLSENESLSLSHVLLFATPWTVAHQAPLSMEFSRQEY